METDEDEEEDTDYIDSEQEEMDDRLDDQVNNSDSAHGHKSPGVTTCSTSVAAYLDFSDLIYQCHSISPCDDESKDRDELLEEVLALRQQLQKLCNAFDMQAASIRAANAHCTIVKHALEDCRTQLQNNTKKRERGSSKVKARYLTTPSLREASDIEDIECQRCENEAAEKEAQKAAETDARNARIAEDHQQIRGLPRSTPEHAIARCSIVAPIAWVLKLGDLHNSNSFHVVLYSPMEYTLKSNKGPLSLLLQYSIVLHSDH